MSLQHLRHGVWTQIASRPLTGGIWTEHHGAPLSIDDAFALSEDNKLVLMHRRCAVTDRCIMVVSPGRLEARR